MGQMTDNNRSDGEPNDERTRERAEGRRRAPRVLAAFDEGVEGARRARDDASIYIV